MEWRAPPRHLCHGSSWRWQHAMLGLKRHAWFCSAHLHLCHWPGETSLWPPCQSAGLRRGVTCSTAICSRPPTPSPATCWLGAPEINADWYTPQRVSSSAFREVEPLSRGHPARRIGTGLINPTGRLWRPEHTVWVPEAPPHPFHSMKGNRHPPPVGILNTAGIDVPVTLADLELAVAP